MRFWPSSCRSFSPPLDWVEGFVQPQARPQPRASASRQVRREASPQALPRSAPQPEARGIQLKVYGTQAELEIGMRRMRYIYGTRSEERVGG